MRIATGPDLSTIVDTMHKYVVDLATLKKMIQMILDDLDRGAQAMYPDVMDARVRFQKYVTIDYTDTIMDYRSWHQFTTIKHCEDVKELVFQQLSES